MRVKHLDADNCNETLDLSPGRALLIYTDDGPDGPCGQSMRTTCPHAVIHWFPSEAFMRTWIAENQNNLGRNKKCDVRMVVIGDWSSPGVISLCTHS